MVHSLSIERDDRALYRIESFCFVEGGRMNVSVSNLKVSSSRNGFRVGFVMRRAASESAAQQELEELLEQDLCLLDRDSLFSVEATGSVALRREHVVSKSEEGLYSLIFARCSPAAALTSFELEAKFWNPGPSFLSACDAALPSLFAICAGLYLALTISWFALLVTRTVHYIHWMMGVLLIFKSLAMISQSMRYHVVDRTGRGEGWQFVYYAFASLKGMTLFVVILLIGTGWSLVKPYLNDREKYTIAVVLALQVVDNVALVVFEETSPGSQRWLTWRDVLHLVDILCCCAILFPIVWSIRHLRQAAAADGKTRDNIAKLTLFRQFYIMVVSYIYFTRIVVFLLAATLPFNLLWLRYLFSEAATILFYTITGLKFRPQDDNPYLPLKREEDSPDEDDILDAEYGAKDLVELTERPSPSD
ncbi:hypothetical protein CTAYLR_008276 [Chrysophaeum taylorii]|uniref:Uncharacterized protein n=1 Tax=Chrysophaeum taylorii TaxID=2483200 RepID=A0AAD7XIZ6_9STRA|nr:hypothetical protein CTAYLR_008276 [Chrysophaeum taylorii]